MTLPRSPITPAIQFKREDKDDIRLEKFNRLVQQLTDAQREIANLRAILKAAGII